MSSIFLVLVTTTMVMGCSPETFLCPKHQIRLFKERSMEVCEAEKAKDLETPGTKAACLDFTGQLDDEATVLMVTVWVEDHLVKVDHIRSYSLSICGAMGERMLKTKSITYACFQLLPSQVEE
jgi:hypothetical protein